MRISIKQSGGFAGANVHVAYLDTATLSPQAARQIEQAVQQADFFGQNAPTVIVGDDTLQYEITVADYGHQYTITFADDRSTQTAQLIRLLQVVEEAGGLATFAHTPPNESPV
jgi:hypothetical protein